MAEVLHPTQASGHGWSDAIPQDHVDGGHTAGPMTLKIERSEWRGFTVLSLIGHIEAEHIAELKELLEQQSDCKSVIFDLGEMRLADRDAVGFLGRCQANGMKLKNCPAYIREWMEREKSGA